MKPNDNEDEYQPFRESLLYQVIREWFSDLTILDVIVLTYKSSIWLIKTTITLTLIYFGYKLSFVFLKILFAGLGSG